MRRRERRKAGETEPRAGKSREERGANTALPPWARAPEEPRPPLERRHRHGLAQGPRAGRDRRAWPTFREPGARPDRAGQSGAVRDRKPRASV